MENGFELFVTKSRARRCCTLCRIIIPKETRHLTRKPLQGLQVHYCRICGLKLLKIAIADPEVGTRPKVIMREHYLKIKIS